VPETWRRAWDESKTKQNPGKGNRLGELPHQPKTDTLRQNIQELGFDGDVW
jgi:hypothetical protein